MSDCPLTRFRVMMTTLGGMSHPEQAFLNHLQKTWGEVEARGVTLTEIQPSENKWTQWVNDSRCSAKERL